ncbi:iron-sulfur protein [Clostridia bacterium]|nr:iron-sulfur protein [Clostridia bacterium]
MANEKAKHIIFYFTGTGNSLKDAKRIGDVLSADGGCGIYSMSGEPPVVTADTETVGFVYPTYFWGIPLRVKKFAETLDLSGCGKTYCYAVTTCGGTAGNALGQLNAALKIHGGKLNYGTKHKMFSNYILMYDLETDIAGITAQTDQTLLPILEDIKNRKQNRVVNHRIVNIFWSSIMRRIPDKDRNFVVSDACTSCGVCAEVCPVKNIRMENGRPDFLHRCERCVACINYCPMRAIDYGNVTQKRNRYQNPDVGVSELGWHEV